MRESERETLLLLSPGSKNTESSLAITRHESFLFRTRGAKEKEHFRSVSLRFLRPNLMMKFSTVDAGGGGGGQAGAGDSSEELVVVGGAGGGGGPPLRNPFVHDLKFTPAEKLKIALMSVTVFPVRLFLSAFLMLLAWPFAFTAALGRTDFSVEPQSWWRRLMDLSLRVIMRALWFCGGFHWIKVKGERALPSEAPILTLAPHSSYFDAIPVTMTMGSIVTKLESKSIPVWGTLINFIRPVFVFRTDQESRRKTVEEIKRRARSGGEWPQMMIFPEGTCTNRSGLIRFKPGAFIPGVPVQPVVLRYPNKLDTVTWTWQGPGAFKILWLTLCQLHNPIEVEYLPIYTPSEEERSDPDLFANNVRRIMAKALQLPCTDLSFDDCQLSLSQGPLRIPGNSSLLQFNRLVRRLGLRGGVTSKVLQQQASRARKLCGDSMDVEGLAQYLNLPVTDTLSHVHRLLDQHGDGRIDMRQYVIALSVVCRPSKSMETLKLGFQMYESEEDGPVLQEDLDAILKTALGVAELDLSVLYQALDPQNTGKFTYDQLRGFLEQHPDFAQECFVSARKPHTNGCNGQTHTKKDN